ncbi:hypothetical protein [Elizabethkingia anophelis]|uniref:hypothetical protein n=1 Tax=Elizabethkingia anophelis TaxID=1117645 RepID=UPI0021A779F5|nr:hypothetical protein [Elizabethkingia anophelis]
MKKNNLQFGIHLRTISQLLEKAATEENPGLYLFENNLRAPLFQLEALARIYSSTGPDKSRFEKMRQKFKQLEDMLGTVDYFDAFDKLFSGNNKTPKDVKAYFSDQKEKNVKKLNKVLSMKGWLNTKQVEKIKSSVEKTKWKDKDEQHKRLLKFYKAEIKKINEFAENGKVKFSNIETGVHEFRRKLRWLSIYAQALQGCIELADIEQEKLNLESYLTESVLNSPYNRLPPVEDNKLHPLVLSKYNFFALSWMIEQLGLLKDQGLSLIALTEAINNKGSIKKDKQAMLTAKRYLGKKALSIDDVLREVSKMKTQFFKDKILENLLK